MAKLKITYIDMVQWNTPPPEYKEVTDAEYEHILSKFGSAFYFIDENHIKYFDNDAEEWRITKDWKP